MKTWSENNRHWRMSILWGAFLMVSAVSRTTAGQMEASSIVNIVKPPLRAVMNTDGLAPMTTVDGSVCVRTVEEAKSAFLYFAIDEDFLSAPENRRQLDKEDSKAYVRVEYYSSGQPNDNIAIEYSSHLNTYERTDVLRKPERPGWYRHTFVLWNGRFGGFQNQRADFRITACGDGDEFIRSIEFLLDARKAGARGSALSVSKIEWSNGYSKPIVELSARNPSRKSISAEVRLVRSDPWSQTVEFREELSFSGREAKHISMPTGGSPPGEYLLSVEFAAVPAGQKLYRACHKLTVPPKLDITLDHPRYRATLFPTDENKTITGSVRVRDDQPTDGSLLLSLEDGQGASLASEKQAIGAREIPFRFDGEPLVAGTYSVHARLLDKDGVEVADAVCEVHKVEPGPVEVRVRDDNVLLVNGKPFFPRGIYFSGGTLDDVPDAVELGFNTLFGGLGTDKRSLELAEKYDLWFTAGCPAAVEKVAEQVAAYGGCPRLLGWSTFDEPGINDTNRELFHGMYRAQLREDPHRFVFTAFHVPPKFERYFDGVDIIMVDPYVVRSEGSADLTAVATTVELARKAAKGRKPVWLIPQAIGYLLEWQRLPTLWEARCETFLGIVHGATGIFPFNYRASGPLKEKGWLSLADEGHMRNAAKRINNELKILEPVLLAEGGTLDVNVSCPRKLHCMAKRWDEDVCLIAVNPYDAYLEASFRVPAAGRPGKVREIFEERDITSSGEQFSDMFRPFAVHAYRISWNNWSF